ncbi:MAG: hypothetical protein Q9187_005216 [Circinaria calcarea]
MEEDRAAADIGQAVNSEIPVKEDVPRHPKKRFIGRRKAKEQGGSQETIEDSGAIQVAHPRRTARALNQVPPEILNDSEINEAIALLPPNYSFEIHKTIHRIRSSASHKKASSCSPPPSPISLLASALAPKPLLWVM